MAPGSNNANGCGCGGEQAAALERRTLWLVLVINAAMFVVELAFGLEGRSTGLIADSLDMLADAGVYALSLLAVGRSLSHQRRAAVLSGRLQIALALLANLICLLLVRRHRAGGVHMRASVIFSTNDTLANLGVIVAGLLVAWSGSPIPDLVIGTAISLLVLHGGRRILQEARAACL